MLTTLPQVRGQQYLAVLSPDDDKFDSKKALSYDIVKLLSFKDGFNGFTCGEQLVNFQDYAIRIMWCGSWLLFARTKTGKLKLKKAYFCKAPSCPMCNWRRTLKVRGKLLTLVEPLREKYPTHRWLFLTLTIRNCDIHNLRETLKHLGQSFNRLSKRVEFPFDGYVKSVEVTRAWDCYHMSNYLGRHGTKWISSWEYKNKCELVLEPTDEVHPHLHVMGLVPASYFSKGYVSQQRWTELWQESLRVEYVPVVDIRTVKPPKKARLLPTPEEFANSPDTDTSGIVKAVCETLKYTVKEKDLVGSYCTDDSVNATWLKTMIQQLYKMRRVEYRGILKDLGEQLEQAYNDDNLVNTLEEPQEEEETEETLEFRWIRAIKKYVKIEPVLDTTSDSEENERESDTVQQSCPTSI